MFQKNDIHRQAQMFSSVAQLGKTQKKMLEKSWAKYFYTDFFCKIDEGIFSVLYSAKSSRPNVPVNILLGFEALKTEFGQSDEDLYNRFLFDLQFRYALGIEDFDQNNFELRTIYNFRRALVKFEKETGRNLINEATNQITEKQIKKFKVKTGLMRMDSTLIGSNIRNMGRLQLLVELITRLYRDLSKSDQDQSADLFKEFIREDSLHYCYRLESKEAASKIECLGTAIMDLLGRFEADYREKESYRNLRRAFEDHFTLQSKAGPRPKSPEELSGDALQSPDDPGATYRKKGKETSKGYIANISESCDPENELQLITGVSVAPNTTPDTRLFEKDVEDLAERTEVEEIWTDAGYQGEDAVIAARKANVKHRLTAIKGKKKNGVIGREDFEVAVNEEGEPIRMLCPFKKEGSLRAGRKEGRYSVGFKTTNCEDCPFSGSCPTHLGKKGIRTMSFSTIDLRLWAQKKDVQSSGKSKNIRAAVESTVRSVIHPFGGHLCKMPVRGLERIEQMIVLSTAMVNIRRITAYSMV